MYVKLFLGTWKPLKAFGSSLQCSKDGKADMEWAIINSCFCFQKTVLNMFFILEFKERQLPLLKPIC